MKKRREKKLENKLKEIGNGRNYNKLTKKIFLGGSLKIYGVELFPNRPYVTLLVSLKDCASKVIRETLDKYGLEKMNEKDFVLVEVSFYLSQNRKKKL